MTKIGSIRLKYARRTYDGQLIYESEKGGYRLHVPGKPDFELLPDYIDIEVATESKWIAPDDNSLEARAIASEE